MLRTSDRKWKEFYLGSENGIFSISSGKRLTAADMVFGNIPFVGASDSNNGITNYIGTANETLDKNVLGVNYNGSVAETFYHPYSCVFSDDVKRLHLKNQKDDKYTLLFLAAVIKKQKIKFTYGYKFNAHRMKRQKILLPINSQGEPDYDFMKKYIMERETIKRSEYIEYCKNRASELGDTCDRTLQIKCMPFRLVDIFYYKRGNQNKMNSLSDGELPLVSAKNTNNGLKSFAQCNGKERYRAGSISLNNDGDGGVGIAYYQPSEYLLDSHCTSLIQKREMSREVKLYICACIVKQRGLFSHGRSISEERLKMMTVMLPVDENNNPDYDYMERCAKGIIKQKYSSYLKYCGCK